MPRHSPASTRFLVSVALAAVVLAGCGGGFDSTSGGSASAGGSPSRGTTNQPPTITGSAATSATSGQSYSFQPTAADPEGQSLTFSVAGKPNWASFDTLTGRLTGTPADSDVGTNSTVVISVTDGVNKVSLAAFKLSVAAAQTGTAALKWVAPTTNADGSPLTNLAGYKIRYGTNKASLDHMVTISSAGTTSYTITGLTTGTWYFTLSSYTNVGVESDETTPVWKTIG